MEAATLRNDVISKISYVVSAPWKVLVTMKLTLMLYAALLLPYT